MTGTRVLRPYQAEAVTAAAGLLEEEGCAQLLLACGTGKTIVARAAAERLAGGGVTVVLVPSLMLAAQTIRSWAGGGPHGPVMAVCSDDTVRGGQHTTVDLPVPVTTDTEVIAKWLADAAAGQLIVGTYDSAHRIAQALHRAGVIAGLTICDEAHRLAGPADKFTAALLKPGVLPDRRRLYMTATPRISTRKRSGELLVTSMDDERVFGPVAYRYPFRRAIAEGYLKDFRIVISVITSRQVAQVLADNGDLAGPGEVPVRTAAAQAALAMSAAEFGLRRCVAFLPRVAQARQFTATLPATLAVMDPARRPAGPLSAGYVHGGMTSDQRDVVLDRLRDPPAGGWSVVSNARCLGEGVDIPAIDSVLFAAPKESVTDIVQAVGRALRRHDDTGVATIIVPALVPAPDDEPGQHQDKERDMGAAGRYENVLRVIRALAAHDEELTAGLDRIRAARAGRPAGEPADLPPRILVRAPEGMLTHALDALRLQVITGSTSPWWDGYGHAHAYYQEHGNLDVPNGYVTAGGFRLPGWLTQQRVEHGKDTLAPGRGALLERIGMRWDLLEDSWMRAYRELAAFAGASGHFEVPVDYRTPDGISLNEWASTQRDTDRAGKLTARRRALLEQAGFPFDPRQARWARRLAQLTGALDRHGGRENLPPGSPESTWLEGQILAFSRGKLTGTQISLLENAGITLASRTDAWLVTCQEYATAKAACPDGRLPDGCRSPRGIDLSDWERTQRARWKAGRLTAAQQGLLTDAGFCLDPLTAAWNRSYQQAQAFKQEHGHLRLPRKHPLEGWLYRQQKNQLKGRLTPGQAALLRDLGVLPPGTEGTAVPDEGARMTPADPPARTPATKPTTPAAQHTPGQARTTPAAPVLGETCG